MPRKKTKSNKSANRPRKTTSFLEKSQVGISLTAEALKNLNEIVEETGLSKSGIFEGLVTGNLAIASQGAEKTISIESGGDNSQPASAAKIQISEGAVSTSGQEVSTQESVSEAESEVLAELKQKIKEHKASYEALKKYAKEQEALAKKLTKQVEEQDSKSAENKQKSDSAQQSEQEIEQLQQQLSQKQTEVETLTGDRDRAHNNSYQRNREKLTRQTIIINRHNNKYLKKMRL